MSESVLNHEFLDDKAIIEWFLIKLRTEPDNWIVSDNERTLTYLAINQQKPEVYFRLGIVALYPFGFRKITDYVIDIFWWSPHRKSFYEARKNILKREKQKIIDTFFERYGNDK